MPDSFPPPEQPSPEEGSCAADRDGDRVCSHGQEDHAQQGGAFPIEEWPSVIIRGLEILNRNNWFPAMTLIIGSPGETDDDVRATLDLVYEVERRGLFAFFIPSVFTPLRDT